MLIEIVLTEKELRELVCADILRRMGDVPFEPTDVRIQVKSKQNFKSEWEDAAFRATLSIST
jgi:hypothetical protein